MVEYILKYVMATNSFLTAEIVFSYMLKDSHLVLTYKVSGFV